MQSRAGGLALLFQPEAFTTNVNDGAAMEQAIESCRGHDGVAGKDFGPMTTTFDTQRSTPLISGQSWQQFAATVILAHELTHVFTNAPNAGVYTHVQMAQAASAAATSLGLDLKGAIMLDFPNTKHYASLEAYDIALSEYFNRTLAYACRKVKL